MKKQIIAAMLMAMVMILMAGCSDDQSAGAIKKWQPQDKEAQTVIGMLTADKNYSVGAFHTGKEVKSVSFGYEYYKGSKLIKDYECGMVNLSEGQRDGLVGVCLTKGTFQAFCAEKDSGGGSVSGTLEGWKKGDDNEQGFSGLEDEKSFVPGEKCYIAMLVKGVNMADPETMLSDKEIMKRNDKNWLFYVVFD